MFLDWLPENISTYGGEIDSLFWMIFYITLAWFIVTVGALLSFALLFRRRGEKRAAYITGDRLSHAAWLLIPTALVLAIDLWIDFRGGDAWAKIKLQVPPSELQVQVTGKQFNWEILYPGPDGQFGTADDLQLDNELHVPLNKVVGITLRSKDVIHSLFLPNLRLQQNVVPGREFHAWFQATKTGVFAIPCTELCGFGHSGMIGHLTVHTAEEYDQWVKEQWPSTSERTILR
ncbi:cytochrome c oxidase subunit II [Candidatus Methylomirabilis sp.]|uniref:cytochrome c oxidase subunit II n=1 Tax=Candidatus Methylomirabilis sp. TaxID=2032687 RepID=UPI002A63DBD3|nr:cytochrome c oxidase subunit II [Candidatus Methylomirabilis sp.]